MDAGDSDVSNTEDREQNKRIFFTSDADFAGWRKSKELTHAFCIVL